MLRRCPTLGRMDDRKMSVSTVRVDVLVKGRTVHDVMSPLGGLSACPGACTLGKERQQKM